MPGETGDGKKNVTAIPPSGNDLTSAFDSKSDVIERALDSARAAWVGDAELSSGTRFGNYEIVSRIGQGGMGTVYRALQPETGETVAIKVLSSQFAMRPDAVRRFHKEAMTLAKIRSPYVIRLVETGEIDRRNFIVSEFVAGGDAGKFVTEYGIVSLATGTMIFRHIASALDAMHSAGMIHRDVKPENILLEAAANRAGDSAPSKIVSARLSDFGLARMLDQTESMAITRTMAVMGTPRFMSPEQFLSSRDVDARSDIYSLGATMYYLLVGRQLFSGEDLVEMAHLHRTASFRPAHLINSNISLALSRIVSRCLEKLPENRFQSAADLLDDLDRLESGLPVQTPTTVSMPLPTGDRAETCEFEWTFDSKPAELWPHISHTSRINRAIGLPPARFYETGRRDGNPVMMAEANLAGMKLKWREHPFSWIENRELTVLREFENGPYTWLANHVALQPLSDGGTRVIHRIEFRPRNIFGRMLAKFQIGFMTRRKLDSVYNRIAERIRQTTDRGPDQNAIEDPVRRNVAQQAVFVRAGDRMQAREVNPAIVNELGIYLERASDAEVARIRPRILAIRMDRDEREMIEALVLGVPAGMFLLYWDVICPRCRVAAEIVDTLQQIRSHTNCKVCQKDFEVDLVESVELVFRVHPEIRETDLRTWCIGGPFHAPHVIAQLQLLPDQQRSLEFNLPQGEYQVTGPQFSYAATVLVDSGSLDHSAKFPVVDPLRLTRLGTESQILTLWNNSDVPVLFRVERSNSFNFALTAARAISMERFRQYLPDQCVSVEQLASVADSCVMYTRLGAQTDVFSEMDEGRGVEVSRRFLQAAVELVRSNEGETVFHFADGITACFQKSKSAIACAQSLIRSWREQNAGYPVARAVLHRGSVTLTSLNGQVHQTGAVLSQAARFCNSEKAIPANWHGVAMTRHFRETWITDEASPIIDNELEKIAVESAGSHGEELLWLFPK